MSERRAMNQERHAEAVRLLTELLEQIEFDPYDPRGGIAEELREVRALLLDSPDMPNCFERATERRRNIRLRPTHIGGEGLSQGSSAPAQGQYADDYLGRDLAEFEGDHSDGDGCA